MAQRKVKAYTPRKVSRRRGRLRPLNMKKKLGPRSGWRGMKKRKRGQGG